jgi:LuxR family transcriptional regulator, maltose regulon positive regulatory protein
MVPDLILATKLFIPSLRANFVQRTRLIERMNKGLSSGCKLILISAPAGFGKTTLVSEWIAISNRSVAWLSLDEGDSNPTRFLTYLIAAFQTIAPNIGVNLAGMLQSPQPPPIESVLTTLLNEISTIPAFALVLDDYHLIDSNTVDNAIAFLLEHMPGQMHLVITTREDPSFPLARMRARGQLIELRAADLRFCPAEAAEFLNTGMSLSLSAADIITLEDRTEGWIAGLQLAAISMQSNKDVAGFIRAFAGDHRYIVDYLVEEVLQRQTEPIRRFLLQTAILDRLNGPLCDAVTAQKGGSARLEALERGNFFVVPLDDQRHWYRYHHLFGEVLHTHLLAEQSDQVATLHRRASVWYEHNGSADDAIRHALAGDDFARAANLIELAMPAMSRSRQITTLLAWLRLLPDELFRTRPVLSAGYANVLVSSGEFENVEARLRDAERWLTTSTKVGEQPVIPDARINAGMVVVDEEEFCRLPGMIAVIRAGQALGRGDMTETVKNARLALDLAPEDDHLMRGGAASQLGLAAWASGDLEVARQLTSEGMANLRLAGYVSAAIGCAIVLANIQIAQGHLREAMITYERGLQWAMAPGALVLRGAADMYVGMSELHREQNDLNSATQHLLTSQSLGDLTELPQNPYRWRVAMARIRAVQGDLDGALDLLDQAERLYNGDFSPNVRPVATWKTRLWVVRGRLSEALGWVREQGLSVENELSYLQEFNHITLARVLIAQYKSEHIESCLLDAKGLLDRLLNAAQEGRRSGNVIEILVLQALMFEAQGDIRAALAPLKHALTLAEPEGYIRIFVDEGLPMAHLLSEAAHSPAFFARKVSVTNLSVDRVIPGYISKLLAAIAAEQEESENKSDETPIHPPDFLEEHQEAGYSGEPLSQRELEVLRLIAQGLSNREISKRLFLALSTIKGHNRIIFDKLQVQSRTEAIASAHALNLL